jgi:hypothetical protein
MEIFCLEMPTRRHLMGVDHAIQSIGLSRPEASSMADDVDTVTSRVIEVRERCKTRTDRLTPAGQLDR